MPTNTNKPFGLATSMHAAETTKIATPTPPFSFAAPATTNKSFTILFVYLEEDISFVIGERKIASFAMIAPILSQYDLGDHIKEPPYFARIDGRTYAIKEDETLRVCTAKQEPLVLYLSKNEPVLTRVATINKCFWTHRLQTPTPDTSIIP